MNALVQHALADVFARPQGFAQLGPFFQATRDLFLRLMEGSKFAPLACRRSYFQLMDWPQRVGSLPCTFLGLFGAVRHVYSPHSNRRDGGWSQPTTPPLQQSQVRSRR